MADLVESVARRYAVLRPHLSEFQRRLWLGGEAAGLGAGGGAVVGGGGGGGGPSGGRAGARRPRVAGATRKLPTGPGPVSVGPVDPVAAVNAPRIATST